MNKEELKQLLKENLTVKLSLDDSIFEYLNVEILFDGDVICKDKERIDNLIDHCIADYEKYK